MEIKKSDIQYLRRDERRSRNDDCLEDKCSETFFFPSQYEKIPPAKGRKKKLRKHSSLSKGLANVRSI